MQEERKTILNIISILLAFILLVPLGMSAEQSYDYSFHLAKKLPIKVEQVIYNIKNKLIYTYNSSTLIVMDAITNTIKKEISMINNSYNSMFYSLRGIGYNSVTKKIYLVASINEVWVVDANNYKITKKIQLNSGLVSTGLYPIYVDEKRNTVYLQTYSGYIVMDGKKDTVIKTINEGVLDFEHDAIWSGYTDATNKSYIMTVSDISTGKVIKTIKTDIPDDVLYWTPHMYEFGDKLFVQSTVSSSIIEYDMENYKILHVWKGEDFNKKCGVFPEIGNYDDSKHLLYAAFNPTYSPIGHRDERGIVAIDTDNGQIVGKLNNITYDSSSAGVISSIISVNPITHALYVSVKKALSENTELQIYSVQSNSASPAIPMYSVIISGILIAAVGAVVAAWLYYRKK